MEETLLQKLLLIIMDKIFNSFPVHDPQFHPTPPVDNLNNDDVFSSFPNFPKIRQPRKYAADRNNQEDNPDACNKYPSNHPSLLPGAMT